MKNLIKWKMKTEDGVPREVRVTVTRGALRWQSKRKDEEKWQYDIVPSSDDWDELQDIVRRRAGRGRSVDTIELVQKLRAASGA